MAPKQSGLNFSDSDYDEEIDIEGDDIPAASKSKGKGKSALRNRDLGGGKDVSRQRRTAKDTLGATYTRTWDAVQEDESGSLQSVVEDLLVRSRRRRLLAPQGAIRRTIIRHLIIIIDLSTSMLDRDMRPTRFDLTLQYMRGFIIEWFDQNPLGQIGIVGMRGGLGEKICDMTGNPQDVVKTILERANLQNAIEMARSSMSHLPTHSSREILVLFGSLTTCDPGNIHDTVQSCVVDRIRISVVALAAEMKICRDMCSQTGGSFGVVLNEGHYKDLMFDAIPPPAQHALPTGKGPNAPTTSNPSSDLLIMGFPTRLPESSPPSLCVCHSDLKSHGYLCPRCLSKLCDVPTDCDICGLTIVSSPHLARSYHHLFPVKPYEARSSVADGDELVCTACSLAFPLPPVTSEAMEGVSPVRRYRCPDCKHDFCSQCDEFIHDILHVCPGCK
ncbi:Ssl1-like-domain-containing protein [Cantharellus anzutake]|uniref:Ssl1-like-domain-containing protein n=1 Tax=Cantharellus anzutake TaxID=1750568 RepID=UPI001908A610|nr:Ssl1-like-domain-containing protein [Cantharellus anzutake]KAF8325227.1 Ssl1-like-domain-containing protein [Cantharellus anzutake]